MQLEPHSARAVASAGDSPRWRQPSEVDSAKSIWMYPPLVPLLLLRLALLTQSHSLALPFPLELPLAHPHQLSLRTLTLLSLSWQHQVLSLWPSPYLLPHLSHTIPPPSLSPCLASPVAFFIVACCEFCWTYSNHRNYIVFHGIFTLL